MVGCLSVENVFKSSSFFRTKSLMSKVLLFCEKKFQKKRQLIEIKLRYFIKLDTIKFGY